MFFLAPKAACMALHIVFTGRVFNHDLSTIGASKDLPGLELTLIHYNDLTRLPPLLRSKMTMAPGGLHHLNVNFLFFFVLFCCCWSLKDSLPYTHSYQTGCQHER